MSRKLYKSEEHRILCGVCGGLGDYFKIDPTIIRILWVILCLCGGSGVLFYIIAAVIIPRQPID